MERIKQTKLKSARCIDCGRRTWWLIVGRCVECHREHRKESIVGSIVEKKLKPVEPRRCPKCRAKCVAWRKIARFVMGVR
jgi:hypothetical protein